MPKMQIRQVSRDARLARRNGRARQGSRLTMLASETASTLPREGAEQRSSAIAYKSVACAASSGSSACPAQTIPGLRNGAQKPLVRSGQEKCPCAASGLSFFFSTPCVSVSLCGLLAVSPSASAGLPACPCVSAVSPSASVGLLACPCVKSLVSEVGKKSVLVRPQVCIFEFRV